MWIAYALVSGCFLATFFWSSATLSERFGFGYGKFLMAAVPVSLVMMLVLAPFLRFDAELKMVLLAILPGIAFGLSSVPFFYSFKFLNALTISIFVQLVPVAVLIESWLFLGEGMSMQQLVAFIIILLGALVAAVESERHRRRDSFLGLALMVIGINLGALTYMLSKYFVRAGLEGIEVYFMNRMGMLISVVMLLCIGSERRRMLSLFATGRRQLLYYGAFSASAIGVLLITLAIAAQPVGMNTSLANLVRQGTCQIVLFVVFFFTRRDVNILRKAVGASIVFAGLVLLALS